ncbi:toxin of the ChpA-ChpR toxin-antitoxin system, endoribonuclease [Crenothrix polyspora]|jgi:mRNA interferase MazF|uniref:Toxin of the ChpA-ChpR toxin-antitoxin system, endoribonuclease n=1 Tax=Crenothrix polyspora TaxID=360316 RepID=A0A1R4H699_9GAMM|nr:endoribonuclease MazF [Crenothrix polyspora]SJM91571.1 toxin of the ChpA-ChpR toxin-antitoxin system, endoribonuclease [Crenothrix polyspora]
MPTPYIPEAGDIVWLTTLNQNEYEQAGYRPAVVLSPQAYNVKTGLLVCVPITNQIKGYPFEVKLSTSDANGVVLADQVKNLDWRSRQAQYKGKISSGEMQEIKTKLATLLTLV